jgi:hypothetical protein
MDNVWVVVSHQGWGENSGVYGVFVSKDVAERKLLADGFTFGESEGAGAAWHRETRRPGLEFVHMDEYHLES